MVSSSAPAPRSVLNELDPRGTGMRHSNIYIRLHQLVLRRVSRDLVVLILIVVVFVCTEPPHGAARAQRHGLIVRAIQHVR